MWRKRAVLLYEHGGIGWEWKMGRRKEGGDFLFRPCQVAPFNPPTSSARCPSCIVVSWLWCSHPTLFVPGHTHAEQHSGSIAIDGEQASELRASLAAGGGAGGAARGGVGWPLVAVGVPGGRRGPRRRGEAGQGRQRQRAGRPQLRQRRRRHLRRRRRVVEPRVRVEGGDRGAGGAAGDGGVAAAGAAADPRAPRAGVRGGGDEPAGPPGAGRHGRGFPVPARAHRPRRHHRHRPPARRRAPGRHGRAPHPGGGGVGAQEQEPREDARLRPRRARRHAARRRQHPQGPRAPPQGHGEAPVPAGGGVRRGREADDRGRRAGGRGGHLRRPRVAPAPDVRGRLPDGAAARRLRLLQGPDTRPPRRRRPGPGRLVHHHQPAEPRVPGGGPAGLAGGVRRHGQRQLQRRRPGGAVGAGRHVPGLLERQLLHAAAADRGGDDAAAAGARLRGLRRLLREPELLPAHGEPPAHVRARQGGGARAARRGRLPRRAADDGRRGLLLLLPGCARRVLLRRRAQRDARVRAHGPLPLLHDRRGRAPHRRRRPRRHRREVPRRAFLRPAFAGAGGAVNSSSTDRVRLC